MEYKIDSEHQIKLFIYQYFTKEGWSPEPDKNVFVRYVIMIS